ncbi:hypothetical protein [Paractinoplanes maris]|uniref:hypothetical protein n=1 Tax=Paractinoplanes maris TaxID=1734446 RepID=UPI002020D4E5|nr:hypothetical protein [Actinoplanes maris]
MVAAGGRIYASDINDIVAGTTGKPLCVARQATGGQTVNHNSATAILWDTEDVDTHGIHSTSSNTDRFTPNKAGWYSVRSTVVMASRADYLRLDVVAEQNGSSPLSSRTREAAAQTSGSASAMNDVDAYFNGTSDYVRILVTQTNGASASATTGGTGSFGSSVRIEYIRP